jgi:hypothetical protein
VVRVDTPGFAVIRRPARLGGSAYDGLINCDKEEKVKTYASSISICLGIVATVIPAAAADVDVQFYSDENAGACVNYSYLTSGKRLNLQLNFPNPPTHFLARVDQLPPEATSQVQIYTMQVGSPAIGATWKTFPAKPPGSTLTSVIFQVQGRRSASITVFFANGTSMTSSMPLLATKLPCPQS